MDDSDVIRANVRAELARANTNAAAMDRRLNWSRAHTSRRLLGYSEFRAHELVALARELGVPLSRLTEARVPTADEPHVRTG